MTQTGIYVGNFSAPIILGFIIEASGYSAAWLTAAGITAIVVGSLYEGPGRGAAYGTAAVGMVVLIVIGLALAAPFIRGERLEQSAPTPAPAA